MPSDPHSGAAAKSGGFTESGLEADSFFMTVTVCFDYAATTGRVDHNYFPQGGGWVGGRIGVRGRIGGQCANLDTFSFSLCLLGLRD